MSVLAHHLPNSIVSTTVDGQFDVISSQGLWDARQGLLTSYPATHHARIEIVRFRNRMDQQRRARVSFAAESEGVEFVHIRHPLMLLARHLERRQLSDTPWCLGIVPSDMLDGPTTLVWAIGSLDGYATRAELLCVAVDSATEDVSPITVERAQKLLLTMLAPHDGLAFDSFDVEALRTRAEQFLLSEFNGIATAFGERDRLLTEKAESAVRSHARRQLNRNERQLARDDLNVNLRNMYLGWSRRIEGETESKLAEIRRKSGIRSSLEIIGLAVLSPVSGSSTGRSRPVP